MIPSFLTKENIEEMRTNAHTIGAWDFNCALGDTMMEKFESVYIKVVELTNVLIAKGARGYFWCLMSPEVSSMFETNSLEWTADQIEMGIDDVSEIGVLNKRWRIYITTMMPTNQLLVGCGLNNMPDMASIGRLTIANYII